ncbi:MAG: phosphopantothenoylcysteine decarboxylase, partial [Oceanobacter sp.]
PERVELVKVSSAVEMLAAAEATLGRGQIFIASAAVADYRPADVADQKIKKSGDEIQLNLVKNPDIVATIASHPVRPFTVGFAAETRNVAEYARGKLTSKNLDLIIANDVSRTDIGFNSDDNAVSLYWPGGEKELPLMSKQALARQLIAEIAQRFQQAN